MRYTQESKHECFKRLAEKRTNKILDMIDLIGNLSNKANYEYSNEEVEQIFSAIQIRLIEVKKMFESKSKNKKVFSLELEEEN